VLPAHTVLARRLVAAAAGSARAVTKGRRHPRTGRQTGGMADSWEDEASTSEPSSSEQEEQEEQAEELDPTAAQAAGRHTGTGTAAAEQPGAAGVDLTGDGGVRKLILRAAPADAPAPSKENYVCVGEYPADEHTYGMWGHALGAHNPLRVRFPGGAWLLRRREERDAQGARVNAGRLTGAWVRFADCERLAGAWQCTTWARYTTARSLTAVAWTIDRSLWSWARTASSRRGRCVVGLQRALHLPSSPHHRSGLMV
jgi:hypothetical protein